MSKKPMLSIEKLQSIIDQFDQEELKLHGIFGISQDGRHPDQCFIKANREGLELFALRLLKAAKDSEAILLDKEKNIIPLDTGEQWLDEKSDVVIQYIEPIAEKQTRKTDPDLNASFSEKLIPYGFGLIALILILSVVVGFFTLVKWIF